MFDAGVERYSQINDSRPKIKQDKGRTGSI